ncbi:glycoside hydrolase family 20 zincin-like fold domain-containing protein [Snuella sedimenti]|uniref:Beta-hexosaminidase bacterial type N-terminal domain-containing protein n=1 Tax=Snuella sedimenti TaxID=2798802 RepID=A0A8J7LUK9_9FLAO|nr:hypothetical protein [Snuella sedimenti]MBJ6369870.1 hypothetical protein [Snuella sedimenti]
MRFKRHWLTIHMFICSVVIFGQNILPTPMQVHATDSYFTFKNTLSIAYNREGSESAQYLSKRLENYLKVRTVNSNKGDIVLSIKNTNETSIKKF